MNRLKKQVVMVGMVYCLLFSACSRQVNQTQKTEKKPVSGDKENSPTPESKVAQKTMEESGLSFEEMLFGNTAGRYAQEAFISENEYGKFYIDAKGLLCQDYGNKQYNLEIKACGGLNYYQEKLYYISSEDNMVYFIVPSKEEYTPKREESLAEKVLTLIVCDAGFVYTDMENQLLFCNYDGEIELLNQHTCLWVAFYGKWIIFSELALSENGKKQIKALHLDTREEVLISDNGLYPTVYNEELYFQGKDGINCYHLAHGGIDLVTNAWGQKFIQLDSFLYYTNNQEIFRVNLKSHETDTMYEGSEQTAIQQMWENGQDIIFLETEKDQKNLWKVLHCKTGRITKYEKKKKDKLE